MAMPTIDHQLAEVAIDGMWSKRSIKVNLGTLMLDNSVIQFDPYSYHEMDKDNKKDMIQCESVGLSRSGLSYPNVELPNKTMVPTNTGRLNLTSFTVVMRKKTSRQSMTVTTTSCPWGVTPA